MNVKSLVVAAVLLANAGCDCAAPMSDFFTAAVQLTGR